MSGHTLLHWTEDDAPRSARWRSENGQLPPKRVAVVDDTLSADTAWRLACEGTALLWRGDYHNARQLLQAMARRAERKPRKAAEKAANKAANTLTKKDAHRDTLSAKVFPAAFHQHRMAQAQRARTLGMLLIPVDAGGRIALRRAPEVDEALSEAFGEARPGAVGEVLSTALGMEQADLLQAPFVLSLRELLGLIGAHEWRRKGVLVPALGEHIHPHYGVFSPIRGEYLELIARAPLPATTLAFDIGTGTGVIAALLARRGIQRVVATEVSPRALACARDNLARLGLDAGVEVIEADLFPSGRAPLVVCNPPWVPAKPTSAIEQAVYDPDSRMLRGFLDGLGAHLEEGGEGWLILSDLAEHLGLRSRDELLGWIEAAGLKVLARDETRPRHAKVGDETDPLHKARAAEVTSLWRLAVR